MLRREENDEPRQSENSSQQLQAKGKLAEYTGVSIKVHFCKQCIYLKILGKIS